ncbi:MAG: stage III sporulation protein AA [Clostridium sp.]|uniref:stage III sporulation protein AA n=1 Tax=Clostridium sp. TaxID=1506 RepID=UPI003F2A2BDC
MYNKEEIMTIFPEGIREKLKDYKREHIQEIRLKINKPLIVYKGDGEAVLDYFVKADEIRYILKRISSYSLYAFEEEIKRGFITIKGGHRVGLAGECVMDGDKVRTIKNISSINIRITREILGCGKKILPHIVVDNEVLNTIIVSPPKCGKTTILRDLSRVISNGDIDFRLKGKKVVVIDERSEIGASFEGIPQMNVGIRTDILDNCYKKEGILMAVRSLSPEVIICDEIGREDEVKEIKNAFNSGVKLVFSVHGSDLDDIYKKKEIAALLNERIIDRVITLKSEKNKFLIDKVYVRLGDDFKCLSICGSF